MIFKINDLIPAILREIKKIFISYSITSSKQKRDKFDLKMDTDIYKTLISGKRLGETENPERTISELALSDHARVVYSSAFRRLQ